MVKTVASLALILLTACSTGADLDRVSALYNKYDTHCREHAREVAGEADEQSRYEECMTYFTETDIHCPNCVVDDHIKKQ